jgi:hypothetical protein
MRRVVLGVIGGTPRSKGIELSIKLRLSKRTIQGFHTDPLPIGIDDGDAIAQEARIIDLSVGDWDRNIAALCKARRSRPFLARWLYRFSPRLRATTQ